MVKKTNVQSVKYLLREHGIAPTQQRLQIANFLFGKQHVSADQILSHVQQSNQPVSKATVYNTLGLFANKGLLREVIIDPNKVFYDTNTEHHHHFYNTDSNTLTDVNSSDININTLPALPSGTHFECVDVIIKVRNQ